MHPDATFGHGGLNEFVDVDVLVENLGLDDEEIAWQTDFIGFNEDDRQRPTDLEPLLRDNKDEIAEDFYANLLEYAETRAIVDRSPKGIDSLKQTQRAYLVSLAAASQEQTANLRAIGESVGRLSEGEPTPRTRVSERAV